MTMTTEHAFPSQSSGQNTVRCPGCGYVSARRAGHCPECGYPINLSTRGLSANQTLAAAHPEYAVLAENEYDLFETTNCIILKIAPEGTNVLVTLDDPVMLGRGPVTAPSNSLDLSDFDAMRYGVSRHHCSLRHQAGQPIVIDLNSANGTYLNYDRLTPGKTYVIRDGDVLTLGALQMTVAFGIPDA